jgi:CheY-like chemotaxis protein
MHLQYRCEIGAGVPEWVNTDRHRLMQILVNLLGNAIKFTHQGHVTLRVEVVAHDNALVDAVGNKGVVKFSVQDSGIGIADNQKPRIFQRFAQAGDDIQSRYGGTGLGLSITRRLVELMGGEIGFDSTWGQGSTFWFTLPLSAQAEPPKPVAGVDTYQNTNPQRLNFLVVDDHPINRLLVKKVLQNHWPHSKVVEAEEGLQAMMAVQKDRFDVIFMDMVMPKMDGIETTQALRRELDEATRNTPVLGLTANVNPQDLERFKAAGLDDVMLKPFEPAQLCAQIEELILNRRPA